jgi:hypothetical protein
LRQAKYLSESVAKLPEACLSDLNGQTVAEVRGSALHDALMDLKKEDKGRSDLVNQIQDIEAKQKRAYLKLFERV